MRRKSSHSIQVNVPVIVFIHEPLYTSAMKILLIEDDEHIRDGLSYALKQENHTVDTSPDGADGSFMARSFAYDAIILDYSLPKKDGLAVCHDIRSAGKKTPILFLSVISDADTKLAAFNAGADDYITKPFSFQELHARLRAVFRRPAITSGSVVSVDDLTLDADQYLVMRSNTPISLTRKEFGLLEFLMHHKGTVVSRALLMEHVWTADSDPFSNTVETHMRNLRKKIDIGNKKKLIVTVPGRGYMITA
jgi:two-component system OmpR family response regulator